MIGPVYFKTQRALLHKAGRAIILIFDMNRSLTKRAFVKGTWILRAEAAKIII